MYDSEILQEFNCMDYLNHYFFAPCLAYGEVIGFQIVKKISTRHVLKDEICLRVSLENIYQVDNVWMSFANFENIYFSEAL